MSTSRTITLFTDRPEFNPIPLPFSVSILAHGLAVGVLSFGIMYRPAIDSRVVTARFTVRRLDLHSVEAEERRSGGDAGFAPPDLFPRDLLSDQNPAAHPARLRKVAHANQGSQTLLQPNIIPHVILASEPLIPALLDWSPNETEVKTIIAPRPQPPNATEAVPVPSAPNQELAVADIAISAAESSKVNQLILPSTTSPVVVRAREPGKSRPATASQAAAQPTPVAIMSVSDLRLKEGTIALPAANQIAPADSQEGSGYGKADLMPGAGNARIESGAIAGHPNGVNGTGQARPYSTTRISLPKDGRFGAVVIGASLEDRFPEMAWVWSGRLTYTVYLHVGYSKNWILQYSIPRSADAAAAGNNGRLEAPWPYDIVRPDLDPRSMDSDAIMVHGFVNQAGRFEALSIIVPSCFPEAEFVLSALEQWQFRAARENGVLARVEVLLIIPENGE
ncbi:MAG TPA: hypothetical protein VGG85_07400 [Terracidiphilus sp.]|jgi:hypothetical protein